MSSKKDNIAKASDLFNKAVFEADSVEERIELYTQAIELYPEFTMAYVNRGADYAELGKDDLAMKDLDMAIKLEPESSAAYLNKASVFVNMKRYKDAIKWYKKYFELSPDDYDVWESIGDCYMQLRHYEDAKKAYEFFIENAQNDLEYGYFKLGKLNFEMGKNKDALKYFNQAIRKNSKMSEAYRYRAITLIKIDEFKNFEKALNDFEKALKLSPNDGETYYDIGITYLNINQVKKGIEYLEKAVQLYSQDEYHEKELLTFMYFNLGNAYIQDDRPELGIKCFTYMIENEPNNVDGYLGRAWCYYTTEQFELAIKDYEDGLAMKLVKSEVPRLIELYIFTNKFHDAFHLVNTTIPPMSRGSLRAQYDYYEYIARVALNKETKECKEELLDLLDMGVKISFPLEFFEMWIDSEPLPPSKLEKIIEITNRLQFNLFDPDS